MSSIQFDPEAIRSLANILRDAGLTEIEIVEADRRIRVVRAAAPGPGTVSAVPAAAPGRPPPPWSPAAPAALVAQADETPPVGAVTSPMVGVAFLTPDPGSPPFVSPGQTVAAGPDGDADRGDEDVQPDQGAARRHGHPHPGRQRPAGRIRAAAAGHRVVFAQDPDRQPRRDRAADPARLPRARHPHRRRALHRRFRGDARAPGRRERLHRPAVRRATATCTSPPSSRPPR